MKNEPPQINIAQNASGSSYGLIGWETFNQWAMLNNADWNATTRHIEPAGLSELDRMRLIAAQQLRSNEMLKQMNFDLIRKNPTPIYFQQQPTP